MLLHKKTRAELQFEWPAFKYFSGSVKMYPAPPPVVESLSQWRVLKFGKKKRPKKRSRAAGKPFMNRNNRSIILLDLLFPKRQIGNKGNIKSSFNQFTNPSLLNKISAK